MIQSDRIITVLHVDPGCRIAYKGTHLFNDGSKDASFDARKIVVYEDELRIGTTLDRIKGTRFDPVDGVAFERQSGESRLGHVKRCRLDRADMIVTKGYSIQLAKESQLGWYSGETVVAHINLPQRTDKSQWSGDEGVENERSVRVV